jgi:hypothetical protein
VFDRLWIAFTMLSAVQAEVFGPGMKDPGPIDGPNPG